jgi:hypothetical protein
MSNDVSVINTATNTLAATISGVVACQKAWPSSRNKGFLRVLGERKEETGVRARKRQVVRTPGNIYTRFTSSLINCCPGYSAYVIESSAVAKCNPRLEVELLATQRDI